MRERLGQQILGSMKKSSGDFSRRSQNMCRVDKQSDFIAELAQVIETFQAENKVEIELKQKQ